MKRLFSVLACLAVSAGAQALSCVPMPVYEVTVPETVYPDSVVWLSVAEMARAQGLQAQPRQTGKSLPMHQAQTITGWVGLKPAKPYRVGETYTFVNDRLKDYAMDYEREQHKLRNSVTIENRANQTVPPSQAPTLVNVVAGDGPWGSSGLMYWQWEQALPKDYLVWVTVARHANLSEAQSVLLRPVQVAGKTQVVLKHAPCDFQANAVMFQAHETLWLQFAWVRHDGQVVNATAPQKVVIKPTQD